VALNSFYSVKLDSVLAAHLMRDQSAHKLALIVLGRELHDGDYLVLVAKLRGPNSVLESVVR